MSEFIESTVPLELVRAAIRAAELRGQDVADVPLPAVASVAGISRSTLMRRIGSRRALDEAVRATGVEPGGRTPVRNRAVDAAAGLISEQGLATLTLEAVAAAADCSVHSLYATFGGRDGLLSAIYEKYSPLRDIERVLAQPTDSLEWTVLGMYRAIAAGLARQPKVAPAMLADAFSRPDGAAGRLFQRYFPRALDSVGGWLSAEVRVGRIRPLPIALLIQQLVGPVVVHMLSRPMLSRGIGPQLPGLHDACAVFAEAFVRAVAVPTSPSGGHGGDEAESDVS